MSKTILAVDDSASVREVVKYTLEKAGYQLLQAVDGQDALNKVDGKTIHLVLTDLNMPRIDGIELIRRMRAMAQYKYLPIVLVTTESQAQKKEEARKAGATGWIVKPFTPEQLLAVVNKVLRKP
jgi:two-component system, chemotaxis family, chemotaxis protein CheY